MAKFDKSAAKARTVARRTAREGQNPTNLLRATAWAFQDSTEAARDAVLSKTAQRQNILASIRSASH